MINLKIIKDAGFAGKAAPADAGPAGPSRGKAKGGIKGGGKKGGADPTSISGLVFWLDSQNPGSSPTWSDRSGNGNDFTAAVAGEYPTFDANGALFTAANQTHLDGPDFSSLTEGEIFFRYKFTSGTGGFTVLGTSGQAEYYPLATSIYNGFGSTTRKNWIFSSTLTNEHTINIWSAASDWAFWINDTEEFATATNTVGFSAAPIMGKSTTGYWMQGYLKTVFMYDHKLTAEDRAIAKAYCASL